VTTKIFVQQNDISRISTIHFLNYKNSRCSIEIKKNVDTFFSIVFVIDKKYFVVLVVVIDSSKKKKSFVSDLHFLNYKKLNMLYRNQKNVDTFFSIVFVIDKKYFAVLVVVIDSSKKKIICIRFLIELVKIS